MSRFIIPFVIILALAGCGDDTVSTGGTTGGAESTDDYIRVLDAVGIATPDDDVAIDLGRSVCDGWDNGTSFDDTVVIMTAGGLTAYDSGLIMGAAALYLCPDHLSAADAWSDS